MRWAARLPPVSGLLWVAAKRLQPFYDHVDGRSAAVVNSRLRGVAIGGAIKGCVHQRPPFRRDRTPGGAYRHALHARHLMRGYLSNPFAGMIAVDVLPHAKHGGPVG
jgi:hypothetical protein